MKYLITFLVLVNILFLSNEIKENRKLAAFAPISSPAIGRNSATGTVLTSNGSISTWMATGTLGISGGSSLFTDGGATTYLTSLTDNLGLGTTTASQLLSVQGNALISGTTTAADLVATGTISIPNSIRFPGGANGNPAILITNEGSIASSDEVLRLGGGTINGSLLYDSGASNWIVRSRDLDGGTSYVNRSGLGFYFQGDQGGDPTIYVEGVSTSTISGNGSRSIIGAGLLVNASSTLSGIVGIGTTTPARLLSVHGEAFVSGTTTTGHLVATGTISALGLEAGTAGDNDVCINPVTKEFTDAGASTCIVSSKRWKHDIMDLENGLLTLNQLRPVSYKSNYDNSEHIGLIAEEVLLVEPRLVQFGYDGLPKTVSYEELTALLVKSIQELDARVKVLEQK